MRAARHGECVPAFGQRLREHDRQLLLLALAGCIFFGDRHLDGLERTEREAGDGADQDERCLGLQRFPPSVVRNEVLVELVDDERADARAAQRDPGGDCAPALEVVAHGDHSRNIDQAEAESADQAERDAHVDCVIDVGGDQEGHCADERAGYRYWTEAPPVRHRAGERAGNQVEAAEQ